MCLAAAVIGLGLGALPAVLLLAPALALTWWSQRTLRSWYEFGADRAAGATGTGRASLASHRRACRKEAAMPELAELAAHAVRWAAEELFGRQRENGAFGDDPPSSVLGTAGAITALRFADPAGSAQLIAGRQPRGCARCSCPTAAGVVCSAPAASRSRLGGRRDPADRRRRRQRRGDRRRPGQAGAVRRHRGGDRPGGAAAVQDLPDAGRLPAAVGPAPAAAGDRAVRQGATAERLVPDRAVRRDGAGPVGHRPGAAGCAG